MKNTYSFCIDDKNKLHVIQFQTKNKEFSEIDLLRSYHQDRVISTGSSKMYILYPGR